MEDDREKVYASIRRRLRGLDVYSATRDPRSPLVVAPGSGFDALFTRFKTELSALGGEAVVVETQIDAANFIATHTDEKSALFVYDEIRDEKKDLTARITESGNAQFGIEFAQGYDKREAAKFECAVTGCIACVAETGSVVLKTDMRLPAALAPGLFVIADKRKLLPSLDEVFTERFGNFDGSNMFLVTGPSRTADIEKQLVKGVHGPKEVYVIFLQH